LTGSRTRQISQQVLEFSEGFDNGEQLRERHGAR
jgi:hypothetical protein